MKRFYTAALSVSCLALTACNDEVTAPTTIAQQDAMTINVCVAESEEVSCDKIGSSGLQSALVEAENGSTILVHPGEYIASSFSDTPFQDIEVRAFLKAEDKALTIVFEDGAVIKPNDEFASSAMLAVNADLTINGLTIEGFRYGEAEDDYYDGHGLFVIGGEVNLQNASMRDIEKMSLTGRNDAVLNVQNLSISDSHMGVWLEEEARMVMSDSKIVGIESAGIAAYDTSVVTVTDSLFERAEDDALYTENEAQITASNVILRKNSPYAARAADASSIILSEVKFENNEADTGEEGKGTVQVN